MGRWRRHAHRAAAGGLYSRDAFAAGATHRAHRGGEARPGRSGGRPSPGALWCPMSVLWSQSDARLTDAVGRGGLLDLGCGTGLFARAATDRGARATGIDLDPAAVARATAEVPEGAFVVGNAQEPPSGPFDVVAAVQLLMHVADPVAVLAAAEARGGGRGGRRRPSGPFDVVAAVQLLMHVADPVAVLAAAGARGSGRGGDALGPGGGVRHSRARRGARPMLGQRPPSGTPITEPTQLRAVTKQSRL